jgi:hypothetical protein
VRVRVARIGHDAAAEHVVRHDQGAGAQEAAGRARLRAGEEGGEIGWVAGLVRVDED